MSQNPETSINSLAAIILAGGEGSRMGGEDKGLIQLNGAPMVSYSVQLASYFTDNIIISSNRNHHEYAVFGYPVVSDLGSDSRGPLAGVDACGRHVTTSHVLVLPCDTPRLDTAVINELCLRIGDARAVVAHDGEQQQSLILLMKTSSLETLGSYLATGRRSVNGWLESLDCSVVKFTDNLDRFRNVNSEQELAAIEKAGTKKEKPSN